MLVKELSLFFQLIQNKYLLGVYFQLTPPLDQPEWNNFLIVAIVEIYKRFNNNNNKTLFGMISGMISISVNVYKQENSNVMKKKWSLS